MANKIAAVGNEQCRIIGDSQPSWGFLNVYRYLEQIGENELTDDDL